MSGVSAGTVDRVLHNRGDVSRASRDKVQKVLDEIDYHPNMFAIGLAAKKRYHIVCIIPYYIEHDYWHSVAAGIDRAAQELRPFNVGVDYLFYSHADKASYETACAQLQSVVADGVLIAPNFQDDTLKLTSYLEDKKIPYAFIDFNMEQTHALCYIGQDSKVSGYIAAKILMRRYREGQELALFLNNQKNSPAEVQMQRRLEGFMQYLAAEHKNLTIHDVVLHKEDTAANEEVLDAFFSGHPKATLGVVFNSRVYQVADYLQKKKSEAGCTGRLRPASEECGTPEKRRSELSHRAAAGTARLLRHQSTVQSRGIQKAGHSRKIYAYRHPDEGKHRLLF